MAKATVKVTPPVLPTREYTLVLNEQEADALLTLKMFIGGDPLNSPRRHLERIFRALGKVVPHGLPATQTEAYHLVHEPKHANRIEFDEYRHGE
jgi:hypothetical protein